VRGTLILVVGPSGAGKDSLIDAARARLSGVPAFVFAQRHITRPPDPLGEAHQAVSRDEFERRRSANAFMLAWQAHGFQYGILRDYENFLRSSRPVIANVSRLVVAHARVAYSPVSVVHVTASLDTLRRRLKNRGREITADREARLRRSAEIQLTGKDIFQISNDGSLEEAADKFVAHIMYINHRALQGSAAE